jgi:hypothetical protein
MSVMRMNIMGTRTGRKLIFFAVLSVRKAFARGSTENAQDVGDEDEDAERL